MKKEYSRGFLLVYLIGITACFIVTPVNLFALENPVSGRFFVETENIVGVPDHKIAMPELQRYTVAAVREMLPKHYTGNTARAIPIKLLSFISKTNYIAMEKVWRKYGNQNPHIIVLGQGTYSLESIYQQVSDSKIIGKDQQGVYTLYQPLYIAPTARLVISTGETLRLSLQHGVFILSNGEFFVVDSKVTVWDVNKKNTGKREKLSEQDLLLKGLQTARPYILALNGAHLYFANSEFVGLGYQGSSGTYGLSLGSQAQSKEGLRGYLRTLPKAAGWFVGNKVEDLFFGFFTSAAENVVLVGNLFLNNVIYNIDPHDDTKKLIIARNVTYGAKKAHGIILSREVSDSYIVDNITFNNGGSGIMLDRSCMNTVISGNLVFSNDGDGIAIFESDNNKITENQVIRNGRNGIFVRNSLDIHIAQNRIVHNGQYGVEASAVNIDFLETRDFLLDPYHQRASVNIDFLETRDFLLDPYHQRASASLVNNTFIANVNSAVLSKNAEKLTLVNNAYQNSGPAYFAGDLEPHAIDLLASELKRDKKIQIQMRNLPTPGIPHSQRKHKYLSLFSPEAVTILHQLAEAGNAEAMYQLGRYYQDTDVVYWYSKAIAHQNPDAMYDFGLKILSDESLSEETRFEGLVLISMAEWSKHFRAHGTLIMVPYFWHFKVEDVMAARKKAHSRILSRKYWNAALWPDHAQVFPEAGSQIQGFQNVFDQIIPQLSGSQYEETLFQHLDAFKEITETYDFVSEELRKRKTEVRRKSNQKKRLRHQRIERQRIMDENATGLRRAYLDRVEEKEKGAKMLLKSKSPGEKEVILSLVREKLALVNQHRAPEARLDVTALPLFPD